MMQQMTEVEHEAGGSSEATPMYRYGPLTAAAISLLVLSTVGNGWLNAPGALASALIFVWLFTVILWGAVGVMRHADAVAQILGEPLGTLILTFSAITIEVLLIVSVMLEGEEKSHLARDTMFAVLMIILNGLIGLSLLLGGIRHRQQTYNLESARAFLGVLLPLAICALVLPNHTISSAGTLTPAQGLVFAVITLLLYGVFLMVQTLRHRAFFEDAVSGAEDAPRPSFTTPAYRPVFYHGALLFLTLLPVALLADDLATVVDSSIRRVGAPPALAGVLIAVLVLAPEGMSALRAAWSNHLQRSVNILMGSVLSSIGLTIPAMLFAGLFTGHRVILGLEQENAMLLNITLLVSVVTFSGARTDMLKGTIHLVLFAIFLMLLILP